MNLSFFRTRRLIRVKDYIVYYLIILLITIFVIFPYYWMILTSIKPSDELMVSPTVWWPSHFDFSNYIIVWQQIPLLRYMGNTLFVAVVTTAVCLVISTATGYSLSRYKIRIREASITLILFTQLIPGMLPFVSFYFLMFRMHLTNTYSGLIIAYSIWGIPFCSLMMKSYFTSAVPISLEESATIDGCTKWGVLVRIALPISVPGLVATSIFSFILAWNEFMWASVMLTDPNKKTVAVGIYNFVGQYGNNVKISLTMTTAVLITVPAMIVFAFFQKYLVSGLTSGAIKG